LRQVSHRPDSRQIATSYLMVLLLSLWPSLAQAADLEPQTVAAFDRYAALTDAEFSAELARREPFLWVEGLPKDDRAKVEAQLRAGEVVVERLETLDHGRPIPAPGGLIHRWIGTAFIPGATLAQTLQFERDYDHQQEFFQPNVQRSKILRHDGDDFTIELVFYKKEVITSAVDTEHAVHYGSIDATHAWSRSHTTRIQEVENPGETNPRLAPEGHDRGFLWRMNTYWRFEEKDGGVYVESQSISLTRDIPTGLGWLVGRFVTSVPKDSLTFTLEATRRAVLQRVAAAH